jgi:hypothetical protein
MPLAGRSRPFLSLLGSTTSLPGTRKLKSHEIGLSLLATTNEIGVEWLKYFNAHIKARVVGTRRLLVLDGHESHHSLEFQEC